ncbi:hypothetical protein ACQWTT_001192 [Acinetobacter baumannii]
MTIIHYLTIQTCKRVFFDPIYGIMRSSEPLIIPSYLNIEPLCLIGVSVDNLPLKYTKYFYKNDLKISLSDFLKSFWQREYQVTGFRSQKIKGIPDVLVIDHRCKELIQPIFYQWLEANGIPYSFSESKNRKAISKFLQHQDYPITGFFQKMSRENSYITPKEEYALSIDVLNDQENYSDFIYPIKKQITTIEQYLGRQYQQLTETALRDVNLSEIQPLESKADRPLEDAYWISGDINTGSFGYLHNRQQGDEADSIRYEKKAFLAAVKALPETQWNLIFTDYQISLLNDLKKQRFKDTINIDDDDFHDFCFRLGLLDYTDPVTLSFNVSKLTRAEISELWDLYSGGGDVHFSCELLLPPWHLSRNNKKFRYFFLARKENGIIFICDPSSIAAKSFDNGACLNHMNTNVFEIRQIHEKINIDHFDEMVLNNRQYLFFLVEQLKIFSTTILDYNY